MNRKHRVVRSKAIRRLTMRANSLYRVVAVAVFVASAAGKTIEDHPLARLRTGSNGRRKRGTTIPIGPAETEDFHNKRSLDEDTTAALWLKLDMQEIVEDEQVTSLSMSMEMSGPMEKVPINDDDFGEPDWETILELAFPTWDAPENGCPRLESLDGGLDPDFGPATESEAGKFNPCYYTKAFAGLDPSLGGYPTPIDTHYPYEFAAPFLKQPGDGSVHNCNTDNPTIDIGSCPKLGADCGPDCATITDDYGIGHIPPFVPLAAIKNEYGSSGSQDICKDWFHYETHGCNILKSTLDKLVYKYFGDGKTIKFQPPILLDGEPSTTYYRLEYGGESPACDGGNCRGPHYCTTDVAKTGDIWGDFCPYVSTGENSGKYRHPHLALAAFELWIANQCMPEECPATWLDSPNGLGYATDNDKATSITWCEMEDNKNPMSQPAVPYVWPNTDESGLFPTIATLYPEDGCVKPAPGLYPTEFAGPLSCSD